MRRAISAVAVLFLSLSALADDAPAASRPVPCSPCPPCPETLTVHRHLGFYLHFDLGIGGVHSSGPAQYVKGGAATGGVSFSIGGALAENLILAGRVWSFSRSSGDTYAGPSVSGVGPEIVAYFMPANSFISVAPSLTNWSESGYTRSGFGTLAAAGKEWWIGDHWGLGVAVQGLANVNSTNSGTVWTFGGKVALSATYN